MLKEALTNAHVWWRIADPAWLEPLDPSFASRTGGRWNPPDSYPTLYLNEDMVTARLNLRTFIAQWPYEAEDLRDDTGPMLLGVALPRHQRVVDVHSRAGIRAVGLPDTYPLDERGERVPHSDCQSIGQRAKSDRLQGIRARSAQSPEGAGRELAWFPATPRSHARRTLTLAFEAWFWR